MSGAFGGAIAIVALLALCVVVSRAGAPPLRPPPAGEISSSSFPIERRPLESARQSFARRGLGHALEAYHYLWGEWPSELADLERSGLADIRALTASSVEPYYYARREERILLLAPPR